MAAATTSIYDEIREVVRRDPVGTFARVFGPPDKTTRAEGRWHCKFHGPDRRPSLTVRHDARHGGRFACWSCGAKGDFVDACGRLAGLAESDRAGALQAACRQLGLPEPAAQRARVCPGSDVPAPASAPEPSAEQRWQIRDLELKTVAVHIRRVGADGRKTYAWERDGACGLRGLPLAKLPLYNTELLVGVPKEHQPTFLVEGEKAADAITGAGEFALATVCGAASIPDDGVLGTLAGREVILWPDNDEPGLLHMKRLAKRLHGLGVQVRMVDVDELDLPDHGDAVEALAAGLSCEQIIHSSHPYTPELYGLVQTVEYLDEQFPETTWLWSGWIPRGYVTLLTGTPGVGKSGLALALARAYLTGGQWPDGTAVEGGDPARRRVLWLETEDSHGILRDRCRAWQVPKKQVLLWGSDALARPDLDRRDTAETLREVVADNGVGLVILDTLAGAHYQDENSANIKRTLHTLTSLAQSRDVAVVALHHLRKRQQAEADGITLDRVRGSSAIAAAARVVMAAWRPGDRGSDVCFEIIKSNLGAAPPPVISSLDDSGPTFRPAGGEHEAPTSPPKPTDQDVTRLVALLKPGQWTNSTGLRARFCDAGGTHNRYYPAVEKAGLEREQRGRSVFVRLPGIASEGGGAGE